MDAPNMDAPHMDAPTMDAPNMDAPDMEGPTTKARAAAAATGREPLADELRADAPLSAAVHATVLSELTAGRSLREVRRLLGAVAVRASARGGVPTWGDVLTILQVLVPTEAPSPMISGVQGLGSGLTSPWARVGGYCALRARLQRLLATMQSAAGTGGVTALGVAPPSGALLYGPSGNGKSLLASCLAAACGWPTFCVKGSQLFGAYVGETEAAIRELFRKARENAPSIVLLDELDAIGGSRGDLGEASEQGGGGTAMERALSTLLNEMDGVGIAGPKFGSVGDGAGPVSGVPAVFLLGLTNRPELVDAALLRPGRLEQLLHVPHPNLEEREAILGVHTRHLTLGDEVNLASIAERTERFSGAALAALCRETTMQALARQWPRRGGGRPMGAKDDGDDDDDDDDGEEEEEEEEEEGVALSGGAAAAFVDEDGMDEPILVRAMDFERAGRVVQRSLVLSDQEHAKLEKRDAKFRASRAM